VGATLQWIEVDDEGNLEKTSVLAALENPKLRVCTLSLHSNVTGSFIDVGSLFSQLKKHHVFCIGDATQYVAHHSLDVTATYANALVFSGHKIYGPTGIGVLWMDEKMASICDPLLVGGGMVRDLNDTDFSTLPSPQKFEAGTPPVVQAIGLASAIEWQKTIPWNERRLQEIQLIQLAWNELQKIDGLQIIGSQDPDSHHGILTFTIDGIHPHDLTSLLSDEGYLLRAGHHCTKPLHKALAIDASSRLSLGIFSDESDVIGLGNAIMKARDILSK
jgi:cysteine desulfurase/selenocysteine lyase